MAARHASVKLSAEFLDTARREAEMFNRSLGAQVEHWARMGRAFEGAPGVGVDRVRAALQGKLTLEDLTSDEQAAVMDRLGESWDLDTQARYAELGRRTGAVGDDARGRLVKRDAAGRLRSVG
jgi:hypothetical protein